MQLSLQKMDTLEFLFRIFSAKGDKISTIDLKNVMANLEGDKSLLFDLFENFW